MKMLEDYNIEEINEMLDANVITAQLPEGKTLEDFTGGYVNILKSSSKVVLFFGYKPDKKNTVSVTMKIDKQHEDLWFKVLKFKRDMLNKKDGMIDLAELMIKASIDDEPVIIGSEAKQDEVVEPMVQEKSGCKHLNEPEFLDKCRICGEEK